MQGINRLGKAAPKPGSLRPPDPNRRQDLDLFSEGAETDADYMRMVHDVRLLITSCNYFLEVQQAELLLLVQTEDTQQNQSGWLFGRGGKVFGHTPTAYRRPDCCFELIQCAFAAFDKGDLLYLRDEEEKRRFTEMELRDSERQQFMKERTRVEAERAAAALRAAQARKDKAGR